jgi:hypothetical protein
MARQIHPPDQKHASASENKANFNSLLASYLGWRRLLERYPGGLASRDVLRATLGVGWRQQLRVT